MLKTLLLITLITCSPKKEQIALKVQTPEIVTSQSFLKLESITPEMLDTCFLLKNPKRKMVCLSIEEYRKNIENYNRMLDAITKLRINNNYYKALNE
jgi:hypothetical protein